MTGKNMENNKIKASKYKKQKSSLTYEEQQLNNQKR